MMNRPVEPSGDYILAWDELRHVSEWSLICGVSARIIEKRIARGMTPELAMSVPQQAHVSIDVAPGAPSSWTWATLSYEDDDWARDFVRRHDHGASQREVAEALGTSDMAVSILERRALAKLLARYGERVLRLLLGEVSRRQSLERSGPRVTTRKDTQT